MSYNAKHYRRKSIRLPYYDYTKSGLYFITICTAQREYFFGDISEGTMTLNSAGAMVKSLYQELFGKFTAFTDIEMIIMPNHIHMIIALHNHADNLSICTVVQWFKTMTTNAYIRGVRSNIYKPFEKRLWQRNYYEHVIRNEQSLSVLQAYIINNPLTWEKDILYQS